MDRKILLISYHFPPSVEVGGLRIANFAKRLPRFGWTPHVLTVKDRYLQAADPERLNDIGNARIFKAGQTPTLSQAYIASKRAARRLLGRPDVPPDAAYSSRAGRLKPGGGAETPSMRLRRYILSFLGLPDPQRNWVLPAVIEAVRAVRSEKIECILTSCPPYSAHLVGLLVKWMTGVRWWIADFRDPWMTTGAKSLSATCAASLAIERWMERAVIRNADSIVTNTETLCDGMRKAYGKMPKDRFLCITNGFDREFFENFAPLQKDRTFTIIYAGSFYFGRTPEPVFQAVHDLLQEGAIERQRIRVRLVGHCRSVEGQPIDELIDRYRLRGVVDVLEPVAYRKAIEMIRQSHLALLLAPNQPYQIPAKIYDYMGAGTRILALAKGGATADLIQNSELGGVFDPSDVSGIKEFVGRSFKECAASQCWIRPEAVSPFDLDSVSRRLAEELNRICVVGQGTEASTRVSSLRRN